MRLVLAMAISLAAAPAATACEYPILAEHIGYAWEDGGLGTSEPGDVLTIVGITECMDSTYWRDVHNSEASWIIRGLVSEGQVDIGDGIRAIRYTGGALEVYADPLMDADWGSYPPNASAPASFVNGDLVLRWLMPELVIIIEADGSAAWRGEIEVIPLDPPCPDCYLSYSWESKSTPRGGTLPAGYDLRMESYVCAFPGMGTTTSSSWGAVKSLYTR